jgi:chromosomal replication initiation ATPase DnaA
MKESAAELAARLQPWERHVIAQAQHAGELDRLSRHSRRVDRYHIRRAVDTVPEPTDLPETIRELDILAMTAAATQIAEQHGTSLEALRLYGRGAKIVRARFAAYRAVYEICKCLSTTGKFFRRDHATIINGLRHTAR